MAGERGRARSRSPRWKALAALAALGWAGGCGSREPPYAARLLTEECTGESTLRGVGYLRFRITGADMDPVEHVAPTDTGLTQLPGVPAGPGRVLEVRGYTALPQAGGTLVALGRSRPFDVPASAGAARPEVPVVLRRVGAYVRTGTAGTGCQPLAEARAGHTATRLPDGRVLLAGGYQLDLKGTKATMLASAELFDPVSGALTRGPALGSRRAFHTATRLPDGQVLLAGGETDGSGSVQPTRSAEVVDVGRGTTTALELAAARARHAAAADAQGRVLLVGGTGVGGAVVSTAEGYDPGSGRFFAVPTSVPRVGMGVWPVGDGRRLAVVGGAEGTALRPEVLLFAYEGSTFVPAGDGGRLIEPRRDGALVSFGGPERLLYVGGQFVAGEARNGEVATGASFRSTRFLASSEVLAPGASSPAARGPVLFPRREPCAVTLPDGRVMTLGGLREYVDYDPTDRLYKYVQVSEPRGELFSVGEDGRAPVSLGTPPLERARHQHTCTVLEDGAVLVVGGLDQEAAEDRRTTLGDLVIYMPMPLD